MRVLKTGLALAITALMALSSIGTASAQASTVVTTTTGGWLTDLDGNLLRDGEGYYVLTISSDKLAGDEVQVDLDRFASLFLDDFRNVSSAASTKKLKIVNRTGRTLTYKDYSFSTENTLPRTDNIFRDSEGSFTHSMGRAYGSAYAAMLSSITSPTYRTDLCLDVQGFDGKNINLLIANLRPVNSAVMDFYGVANSYDISLPQMLALDQNLRAAGYTSNANYLKRYYNVADLRDIPLEEAYNVLGTTRGAQTGITNWRDNTMGGKPIPVGEVGALGIYFKVWGIMDVNADPEDRAEYPYVPNYFIMETDPEVLAFAYDYLYTHGIRFTLDDARYPFDRTDSEAGRGGIYGIRFYVEQVPENRAYVEDVLGTGELRNGEAITLDHVAAGLYVPNAWNQNRLYDFGFGLSFAVKRLPLVPETGGGGSVLQQGLLLAGTVGAGVWLVLRVAKRRRPSNDSK